MKLIIDKRNYFIWGFIIILFVFLVIDFIKLPKEKLKIYNYLDTKISVNIYNTDKKTFENVDKIYKEYDDVLKEINSIKEGKISKEAYELISYGKKLNKESELLNINSKDLLNNKNINNNVEDIKLKKYEISGNLNIDVNSIIKNYATTEVVKYLKENKIEEYIINNGGNITLGKKYDDTDYKVSINDKDGDIVDIVKGTNISVVTKGNTETFESYMINPKTKEKADNMNFVVVIGNNINETEFYADVLYLMSIEDGKKYIKDKNVAVMWYTKDNKKITTENFKEFED